MEERIDYVELVDSDRIVEEYVRGQESEVFDLLMANDFFRKNLLMCYRDTCELYKKPMKENPTKKDIIESVFEHEEITAEDIKEFLSDYFIIPEFFEFVGWGYIEDTAEYIYENY